MTNRSRSRSTFRAVLSAALLIPAFPSIAQVFSITDGLINSCSGAFLDSGGQGASGYGNNESYVATICPDNPDDAISVTFPTFNLSTQGPNPIDYMTIYDGNSTSAPTIGTYTGTELQGYIPSATFFNTSGCLTFEFFSNGAGTGVFAGSITCFTPCQNPTAIASMSEAIPALVCVGEVVQFDGSASDAVDPFNVVSWEWDFDDGSPAVNTPSTSHSFSQPGEYMVQLTVTDDNDCQNVNLVDLQVLVSTTPEFAGTSESVETCLGATVDLSAVVTPTTWTGLPEVNFGEGVYLEDDPGSCFESGLPYSLFDPGQTLQNANDLLSICVSMEHSYMGDLIVNFSCPNGQSVILHQQNGGGTFLGNALDGETVPPTFGECWSYCWSPTATNGTWVDNSGTSPLPAGTYESLNPMSSLVGCPLNGTWTLQICDMWGADDGTVCEWSINFSPSIIPDATQFTPDVGTSTLDSAFWSGPDLVTDPLDPLHGTASPSIPGDYSYTFFVTDNFGCNYDTTIMVTVAPQMQIDAGADMVLCNTPEPMAGVITANAPVGDCIWTLILFDTLGDGWDGASIDVSVDGNVTNHTMAWGPDQMPIPIPVTGGMPLSFFYYASGFWNNEHSFQILDESGNVVYQSIQGPPTGVAWQGDATCGGATGQVTWSWSPTTGLDDPTDPLTNVFVTEATWFYLTAYAMGNPACAVMDSVLVSPDPSINAGLDAVMAICASEPAFLMTDSLAGTPDAGGVWTTSLGGVVPGTFDPETGASDTYTYTVTSLAGCQATSQLDITVIPSDDPTCCGVPDAGMPTYSCDLTVPLTATPGNTGVGVWQGPAGAVFANANDAVTTVTMPPGSGGAHWIYWVENDGAFCNTIDSVQMTFTDAIVITFTPTDAICFNYCDGTTAASVAGGNAAVDFTYDWAGAVVGSGDHVSGLCAGIYGLTVTDDNGCIGMDSVTIAQPVLLEIDSLATHPVTCSGDCDGQVEIYDVEALQYSFDDGMSWAPDAILPNACEGVYPIRIKNLAECTGTGAIEVTGPPPVIAHFEWNPIPANVNDPTIYFGNLTTGAQTYFWDIAGLTTSTEFNPSYRFSEKEPGTYEVCMVAYNYNQCTDTICYNVIIDDVLFTYIPNSFTPDGDGLNDTFWMTSNIPVMSKFEFMVFDRWGQLIYETNDPYKPWLGSHQNSGEVLPEGVYAYRVLYEIQQTEVRKELMGHVTLIK